MADNRILATFAGSLLGIRDSHLFLLLFQALFSRVRPSDKSFVCWAARPGAPVIAGIGDVVVTLRAPALVALSIIPDFHVVELLD